MPYCIRNSVLTPIPKGTKNTSSSQNYRAIALASILSRILEHLLLDHFRSFFRTSHLQIGFKSGLSTSMCTGALKSVVSHFINRDSAVFGCFLDTSKAFDLVNHEVLLQKLIDRGLPLPVSLTVLSLSSDSLFIKLFSASLLTESDSNKLQLTLVMMMMKLFQQMAHSFILKLFLLQRLGEVKFYLAI